ncbi:hypothetical protein C2G38_2188802 [Gigaspora rosea]|uniref:Uncharacterized protein n=1 Tax=Gigaspora rosea TaxID=44941 RepID=A0A397V7H6_9GLOM|nr:hypothetical protein C2G38_2188802 [Gigaspora rosea]
MTTLIHLCRFVEQVLLRPLKDSSIKHSNEEALKQAFLDALVLTFYADIEPEFQMECIKLDGARDSWQEATRISLSLMTKLDDEILNLEINDLPAKSKDNS